MYHDLGAHLDRENGNAGVRFAVWAPNAVEVSVLADRNDWTPSTDTMLPSDNGVWRCFLSGTKAGDAYKFGIRTATGELLEKADPLAFHAEAPPKSASLVCDLSKYDWHDTTWMQQRAEINWLDKPMSIYEAHLASWRRPQDGRDYFNYRELAQQLGDYLVEMGFTHLQLMPICEYPFDGSWGYQTTGYFAPTSRFGTPDDFKFFVDHFHGLGIGVLIDWVPAHFPADGHGLSTFDGTCCYEHQDPREGYHPDWQTHIFNYGRHEVREFLFNSARFWLEQYHVDGIRVDAVASMLYRDYSRKEGEWIPNDSGGRENLEAVQFLKDLNTVVHREFPGAVTVAEESTSWPGVSRPVYDGGLGFTMKWDMGWMNDTLQYLQREPIHRSHHQGELSFRMVYAFSENFVLPLSHDEVVHGKGSLLAQMPGDKWQKLANLRLLLGYQFTTPGKNLMFMGGEFAQEHEWNHSEQLAWDLLADPQHNGIRRFVGDLNRIYTTEPALNECDHNPEGFEWVQCDDTENSVFVFTRFNRDKSQHALVVMNYTPIPRSDYRIGVRSPNGYVELLSSDAKVYGGGNIGNGGFVECEPQPMHGQTHSVQLQLPPLGILILKNAT